MCNLFVKENKPLIQKKKRIGKRVWSNELIEGHNQCICGWVQVYLNWVNTNAHTKANQTNLILTSLTWKIRMEFHSKKRRTLLTVKVYFT